MLLETVCLLSVFFILYQLLIWKRKKNYRVPDLSNKVAIVTGASRGIGKGIAIGLAEGGATIYITGRSKDKVSKFGTSLQDTADAINRAGGVAHMIECDHFEDDQIISMIDEVFKREGRVDVLVNNVFFVPEGRWTMPFWEQKMGYWDPTFAVGLRCHYLASCYAAEKMVEAKSGLIVNISSCGAKYYMYNPAYGAGKAALDKMSIDMGKDLDQHNVASISLWPGIVKTEYILHKKESIRRIWGIDVEKLGEDPLFSGRAVASLIDDKSYMRWNKKVKHVAELAEYYGFRDTDGSLPPPTYGIRFFLSYAWYRLLAKLGF